VVGQQLIGHQSNACGHARITDHRLVPKQAFGVLFGITAEATGHHGIACFADRTPISLIPCMLPEVALHAEDLEIGNIKRQLGVL